MNAFDYITAGGVLLILLSTLLVLLNQSIVLQRSTTLIQEVASLRTRLDRVHAGVQELLLRVPTMDHIHLGAEEEEEGFSTWEYRSGTWQLVAPGDEPSPPPVRQGRFEGEIVLTQGRQRVGV